MTLVERAEHAGPAGPAAPPTSARRRPAPLWAHVAAVAVVLIALIPVIGTAASFSADEGAAIIQAHSLADGDGWIVKPPVPGIDHSYPLELSEEGTKGVAPFAKHPLYAVVLAAADRVGGITAMVLLSVFGTLAAAALAALIARRIDPTLAKPTLWVVGLASPLLFDGYLVIAHALGAAAVAAAVLITLVALERRSLVLAAATTPLIALAVLLRTEAALLAVALAAVMGVVALSQLVTGGRAPARSTVTGSATGSAMVVAVSALAAALGARLLEKAWATAIVGLAVASATRARASDTTSFIGGRLHAFSVTWLRPSYYGPQSLDAALFVMLASIALGVFIVRRRPTDHAGIVLAAMLAVGSALAGLLLSPQNLVPGLLVAFPIGCAGLLAVDRATLATTTVRVLLGTFALFSLAVLATQYANGGTAEWGGRYFAIGLPLLVPVALLALKKHTGHRVAAAALIACTAITAVMGVASIRGTHRFTDRLMTAIDQAGGEVQVATSGAIPRLAWPTFDRQRWLLVEPDDLAGAMARLHDRGVRTVTFVTRDAEHEQPKLGAAVQVTGSTPTPGNGWSILSIALA